MRSSLRFSIVEDASGDMILGDSIVLFEVSGSRRYKTLLEGRDELKALFLPLTPKSVLVGTTEPAAMIPIDLREAIGRCSFEYFISSERTDRNESLQGEIGEDAPLLSEEEMNEIADESLRNYDFRHPQR